MDSSEENKTANITLSVGKTAKARFENENFI